MTPTAAYICSICGEPSVSICAYCTKDACPNHVCERCARCSDCCACEVRRAELHEPLRVAPAVGHPEPAPPAPQAEARDEPEPEGARPE